MTEYVRFKYNLEALVTETFVPPQHLLNYHFGTKGRRKRERQNLQHRRKKERM